MIYSEVIERCVQGVVRAMENPPSLDRIRMRAEAAFPQINSQVAEAFAAREDRRPLLRTNLTPTFTAGAATLSDVILKKYIKDATLSVVDSDGNNVYMSYIESHDYDRVSNTRLGYWKIDGAFMFAKLPPEGTPLVTADVDSVDFICIAAPSVPASGATEYTAPPDMESEVIDALVNYLLGDTVQDASEAA